MYNSLSTHHSTHSFSHMPSLTVTHCPLTLLPLTFSGSLLLFPASLHLITSLKRWWDA